MITAIRSSIRTNYLIDEEKLRRYIKRTDFAAALGRPDFSVPSAEAAQASVQPLDDDDMLGSIPSDTKDKPGKRKTKSMLALLISAHNEELVIEGTIRSAIRAGQPARHIFVVDDNSSDNTSQIAKAILGQSNVLRVGRSGKGLALTKAAHEFDLVNRYKWIHIADADGGFAQDYFHIFRRTLDPKFAAATGYVRSLPGSNIGQYRVFEYTLGMELHRRFQAMTHTVTVIPGPTSCFRSDVFAKVNFANKSITEDFDVTLQIHRQKLGKIQFIPQAVAYTQDPRNLRDFTKQITRWNRGIIQGVRRHHIGFKFHRIDAYLSYQIMMNFFLLLNYMIVLPYAAFATGSLRVMAVAFLMDVALMFGLTVLTALKANRKDIISAFPQIYLYRFVTLAVFLRAFFEVVVLRKFRVTEGIWGTAGRRYKNTVELP
jgi:cellulose synthase/poly-beta-1,6-N-acetylglucosamine synthase-like glycosyltransferase